MFSKECIGPQLEAYALQPGGIEGLLREGEAMLGLGTFPPSQPGYIHHKKHQPSNREISHFKSGRFRIICMKCENTS